MVNIITYSAPQEVWQDVFKILEAYRTRPGATNQDVAEVKSIMAHIQAINPHESTIAKYNPGVGDVVEFVDNGTKLVGIVQDEGYDHPDGIELKITSTSQKATSLIGKMLRVHNHKLRRFNGDIDADGYLISIGSVYLIDCRTSKLHKHFMRVCKIENGNAEGLIYTKMDQHPQNIMKFPCNLLHYWGEGIDDPHMPSKSSDVSLNTLYIAKPTIGFSKLNGASVIPKSVDVLNDKLVCEIAYCEFEDDYPKGKMVYILPQHLIPYFV